MVIQKDVFWKSALLTIIVLFIGIQMGVWLDSMRLDEIKNILTESELQFRDAELQTLIFEKFFIFNDIFCDYAIDLNLKFNEKIYQEGLKIEKAEIVNRFTPSLLLEKRRYALLQLKFWINSLTIKEKCNSNYSVLLYLYVHNTKNNATLELNQKLQSAFLLDLKDKCGNKLMLSPLPIDMNLTSIDFIIRNYNITEVPTLIIDKNIVIQKLTNMTELERYIKC
ncbi:MAG: hypothetical protein QXD48_01210 [Candidatus Aenigmatarchaeota archaeon]